MSKKIVSKSELSIAGLLTICFVAWQGMISAQINYHDIVLNNWERRVSKIKLALPNTKELSRAEKKPAKKLIFLPDGASLIAVYDDHFALETIGTGQRHSYRKGEYGDKLEVYNKIHSGNLVGYNAAFSNFLVKDPLKGPQFSQLTYDMYYPSIAKADECDTALILYCDGIVYGQYTNNYVVLRRDHSIRAYSSSLNDFKWDPKEFVNEITFADPNKWIKKSLIAYPGQAHFLSVAYDSTRMLIRAYRQNTTHQNSEKLKSTLDYFGSYNEYSGKIELPGQRFSRLISISDDGLYLFYTNEKEQLIQLNLSTGIIERQTAKAFTGILSGKLIKQSTQVFLNTNQGCYLYDLGSDSLYYGIKSADCAEISDDGKTLVLDMNGRLMVHNGLTGKFIREHSFVSLNRLPKYRKDTIGTMLASFFDSKGNWCLITDDHIKVLDKKTHHELKMIPLPQERMCYLEVLNFGKVIKGLNVTEDSLLIFMPENAPKQYIFPWEKHMSYVLSDDGKYLALRRNNSDSIQVYTMDKPGEVKTIVSSGHWSNSMQSMIFTGSEGKRGLFIAKRAYKKNTYEWFDLQTGLMGSVDFQGSERKFMLSALMGSDDWKIPLRTPGNNQAMVPNQDENGRFSSGQLKWINHSDSSQTIKRMHYSAIHYMALSPDGKNLITGNNKKIYLWEIQQDAIGKITGFNKLDSIGTVIDHDSYVNPQSQNPPNSLSLNSGAATSNNNKKEDRNGFYTRKVELEVYANAKDVLIVNGYKSTSGRIIVEVPFYNNGDIDILNVKASLIIREVTLSKQKFEEVDLVRDNGRVYLEKSGPDYYEFSAYVDGSGTRYKYYFTVFKEKQ